MDGLRSPADRYSALGAYGIGTCAASAVAGKTTATPTVTRHQAEGVFPVVGSARHQTGPCGRCTARTKPQAR